MTENHHDPLAAEHPFFEGYSKRSRAEALAEVTEGAYSYDDYTERGWLNAIYVLVGRGFCNRQIAELMRSKHPRWAGDGADRHDRQYNSADLVETHLEACLVTNRLVSKWVPSEQSHSDESHSE